MHNQAQRSQRRREEKGGADLGTVGSFFTPIIVESAARVHQGYLVNNYLISS